MPVYAFQHILKGPSGLATDRYVNTWHFWRESGPVTDFDNVRDMLKDFYTKVPPAGQPICTQMSNLLSTTADLVAYNLDDAKPRQPVYTSSYGPITWGSGNAMPYEVALCASFQGAPQSGEAQARKRNRVYIGPFRSSTSDVDGHPNDTCVEAVFEALKGLRVASGNSVNWTWSAYSALEHTSWPVQKVWVDDAWDTQRRRGMAPTKRYSQTY